MYSNDGAILTSSESMLEQLLQGEGREVERAYIRKVAAEKQKAGEEARGVMEGMVEAMVKVLFGFCEG